MNVFIKRALYMGKIYMLITKQKHTVKLFKLTYIRITKTKHLSSTKSIPLDPWTSELTEKLLNLEVNLGFIIAWRNCKNK